MGSLKLFKTKAPLSTRAVQHSPKLQWQRVGNGLADSKAKVGACLHAVSAADQLRISRAEDLARTLFRYFARVLDVLVRADMLPLPTKSPFVVPRLPCHSFAVGPGGLGRCVRCFKVASAAGRALGPCVSRDFRSYLPVGLGPGIFSARCGDYSFLRER